jgi:hypothetical protein
MWRRGIKRRLVEAAAKEGSRTTQPDGRAVCFLDNLTVVLAPDDESCVLTAYWGRFKPEWRRKPVRPCDAQWLARVWGAM